MSQIAYDMAMTFQITRRVQFAETDMAGILHFANYYRLMEEVEHAFWRSKGTSVLARNGAREITWPRVAASCEFSAPARFEDELSLTLTVVKVSNRSVTFEIEFRRDETRLAVGRITAVCCAVVEDRFQPIPIPDHLRGMLEE